MTQALLQLNSTPLLSQAEFVLAEAKKKGVTEAEVYLHLDKGFSVTVRNGQIDTVEHHNDKSLSITVYFGHRKGHASTTDLTQSSVLTTLNAACEIADIIVPDICQGLADRNLMAFNYPDLDLYHPWGIDLPFAISETKKCEAHARTYSKISNSEGSTLTTIETYALYGNTHNFFGYYPTSNHSLSCVLVAGTGDHMQRDYDYTLARDPKDLLTATIVAEQAAKKTIARLGAKSLKTQKAPVLLTPEIARRFWKYFLSAINGYSLYRSASFLLNRLEHSIFPNWLTLTEKPHLLRAIGSAPFDGDGVATREKNFVEHGKLISYLLDTYTSRKLGMSTTGNAGGCYNLTMNGPTQSYESLLKHMHKGLVVTELLGHGVDIVTGDFSQGAVGFWVEYGEIQFPVHEVTIAGNLSDMFAHVIALGSDIDTRGSILTGSVLLEEMTIAGQ